MTPVIIGNATLYCGDCRDIIPLLSNVDAVITDPPYEISAAGGGIGGKRQYLTDIRDHIDTGFDVSILSESNNWFVFCGKTQLIVLVTQAESQGLRWQLRTWNKTNPTPLTNRNYLPDTEYMVHAFKSHIWPIKKRWIVGNVEKSGFDHPTVKPQYVMEDAILCASNCGDTVADWYMGSGSTGVAANNLGRKFIGIEREPKYFDIACQRIENAQRQESLFSKSIQDSYEQVSMFDSLSAMP